MLPHGVLTRRLAGQRRVYPLLELPSPVRQSRTQLANHHPERVNHRGGFLKLGPPKRAGLLLQITTMNG